MIPVFLVIEGLYSYQNRQEINFEQLTEAQLFGIFGATGSGKSSILEAMMFVLYGRTERLNQKDKGAYNMMNLKSDKLWIDFEFKIKEKETHHYRFTIEMNRNKKKFDEVKTGKRATYIKEGETWLPIEKSAEEIIGLNYENFKKTIIIPQGQFQDFLQLGSKDRTVMLREIFHLEKYNLDDKAKRLEQRNNLQIEAKNAQIQQLGSASTEALEILQQELDTQLSQRKAIQKEVKELEVEEKLWDERKKSLQNQQKLKADLTNLQAKLPSILQREEILKQYKYCIREFKSELEQRTRLVQESEELERRESQKKENQTKKEGELKVETAVFERIEQTYNQRNHWIQEADELDKILEIKILGQKLLETKGNYTKGEKLTADKKEEVTTLKKEAEKIEQNLLSLNKKLPDITNLLKLKVWFDEEKRLLQEVIKQEEAKAEKENEVQLIDKEKLKLLKTLDISADTTHFSFDEAMKLVEQEQATKQATIAHDELEIQQLIIRDKLKSYAEQLIDGEPCPLCGALHHPNILDAENIDFQLNEFKENLSQNKKRLQLLEKMHTQLEGLGKQEKSLLQQLHLKNEAVAQAKTAVVVHENSFLWEVELRKKGSQYVEDELNKVNLIEQEKQLFAKKKETNFVSLQKAETDLAKYEKRLQVLKEEENDWVIKYQVAQNKLEKIQFSDYELLENSAVEQKANYLRQQVEQAEKTYQNQKAVLTKKRDELHTIAGEMAEMEKRKTQLIQDIAHLTQHLNQKLEVSPYQSFGEIENVLKIKVLVEQEEEEIERFKVKLQATERELDKLNAQLEGMEWDETKYLALKDKLFQLKQENERASQKIGGYQAQIVKMQQEIAQKEELETELNALDNRAKNIAEIRKLFRSEGFVNYVSTIFLQNLCNHANQRFKKLTKDNLHLEITADNDFQVRDYIHDGKTRNVKTLSGGQTFQAALSLALALSDSVQKQAQSHQNFFFIDEGFGSQDKESLKMIFDTLQSLRKENRIVGIISHVEDLQQEIERYLSIKNDPEKGSFVQKSWE